MLSTLLTLVVIPAVYMVVPSRIRAEADEPVDEQGEIRPVPVEEAAS
jgi:hypothetical protein